jgi:perosamine synthetase
MIPHSKVVLAEEDVEAVSRVLRSGLLVQGIHVASLEGRLAAAVGVDNAAAVSSGSAALHLSLLSLGIGPGAEVIVPSYVCTALLNAVCYAGARPVLVDIEPDTYNISPLKTRKAITSDTAAIIVPHMFGLPADMDALLSFGVPLVEDCAQAVGCVYRGRPAGSMGRAAVFSLYATKVLCAGEGGLVLSNDKDLIEKVRDLRDYDEKQTYRIRYNYKLTDMQAALAINQLDKLPLFIEKRRRIARIYNSGLEGVVPRIPMVPEGSEHIYYRYVMEVEDPAVFMAAMEKRGIVCRRPVFRPLHQYLESKGFEVTEAVWSRAVSIPIYPSLKEGEAREIVDAVKAII